MSLFKIYHTTGSFQNLEPPKVPVSFIATHISQRKTVLMYSHVMNKHNYDDVCKQSEDINVV